MSEHKRIRNQKQAALILVLCLAAVWITGYAFYRSEHQVQEASVQETYEDVLVGTLVTEDVTISRRHSANTYYLLRGGCMHPPYIF